MTREFVIINGVIEPLPARVPTELAAKYLGFRTEHIPVLIAAKLLRPLGRPPDSAPKYHALCVLQKLANDPLWLSKASDAIVKANAFKNQSRVGNVSHKKTVSN